MARTQINEVGGLLRLPTPPSLTVNIAIKGNRKSKYIVEWALEKFVQEGMFMFKLIIVRPKINSVPTPVGQFPVLELRKNLVTAYRKKVEWQTDQKLLRYKMMCIRKKVDAEIVQIESDDVINALSREVDKSSVSKLVIGASSHGMSSRCRNVSLEIAESIPKFCTVYVVSKGKLSALRPNVSETHDHETNKKDDGSEISSSTDDSPIQNTSSHPEWTESNAVASPAHLDFPCLPMQRFSNVHQALLQHKQKINIDSKFKPPNIDVVNYCPGNSAFGHPNGAVDSNHNSRLSHQDSRSDALPEFSLETQLSQADIDFELERLRIEVGRIRGMYPMARTVEFDASRKMNVDFELEKLRIELRHIQGMYAMAQRAAIDASRKVNDLHKRLMEDSVKLEEINAKKAEAKELAIQERLKYETAKREAEYMKECAEREAAEKKEEENKALQEAEEKEKLENILLIRSLQQYDQKFKRDDNLEGGLGTYGTMYNYYSWHHTTTAAGTSTDQKFTSADIDGDDDDDRDLLSWKLGYWLSNIEKSA